MWELELRNAGKSSFYLWLRGTYEECVAEMFSMRERGTIELDGMRLTWSSGELELELVVQHQHVWHEDLGLMVWRCVYDEGCPARITWEELHAAGMAATADTLNTMWEVKQQ